ncbi:MAG: AAA family ATPase [Alphaproteobacteria bacterium]|nr:AAA family ATPase [Alphaproteobacteria bacterium]
MDSAATIRVEAEPVEDSSFTFGPYVLSAQQRVLRDGDRPVPLGSRAIGLLFALVERAGEVVGKDELIARVWPDTFVEESNLRVHVAALRRALGDGRGGARYILNVPGRGYSFVAPVSTAGARDPAPARSGTTADRGRHLPIRLSRTIGRSAVIGDLSRHLPARRFVTIVGPGGIGKTTVALAIAEELGAAYADPVRFVDLSSLSTSRSFPAAIIASLGIGLPSGNTIAGLIESLRDRHGLIVLDNCELVLEEVAEFAEAVLRAAPDVHILATSREPLRADGEWVHRLGPLDAPPARSPLDARSALAYPAVELFLDRASSRAAGFQLTDETAEVIGEICRRLDGMPLAIELAAATVDTFGVHELARRLHDCFAVLTRGRRTALPRHQTLRATLDWSYGILTAREQTALRRLAVFHGRFTVDAATAALASADLAPTEVPDILSDLVAKSLVIAEVGLRTDRYRLLLTTRAYAMERLDESGEKDDVHRRYARFLTAFLRGSDVERETYSPAEWREAYAYLIDDIQGAFDWAFSGSGEAALGVSLTIESAPVWFRMSLMGDHREHAARALAHLDLAAANHDEAEMRLAISLGHASWHVSGPGAEMAKAFGRALGIAERIGDARCQMRALWGLWSERNVCGDYPGAARMAERYESAALGSGDRSELVISDRMLALSSHFVGRQAKARLHAERTLEHASADGSKAQLGSFQFDLRVGTNAVLARILWLQGFPEQAVGTAEAAVGLAFELGHTLSQCFALYSACMVAIWTGDTDLAANNAARLIDRAAKHALTFWEAWGRSYKIALALPGDPEGLANHPDRDAWRNPICGAQLPEVMTTLNTGFLDAALLARIGAMPENWCASEIERAHGEALLLSAGNDAQAQAEARFHRALSIAQDQGARSWELRAATSLARLMRRQGRAAEAEATLAPVVEFFTEGHGTADLADAGELLADLRRSLRAA